MDRNDLVKNFRKTLIHVLAVHPARAEEVHARATIRAGSPKPGDRVWFQGTGLKKHELEIISIRKSSHLWTIALSGSKSDLEQLVGGTYIYDSDIGN
jgi:hypothetical protein